MYTPQSLVDSLQEFQRADVRDNTDYMLLAHSRDHLNGKLLQKKCFMKQLSLFYAQLDKTRNYQEFVDALMGNRELLREIFTLEKFQQSNRLIPSSVDWSKFGLDMEAYLFQEGKESLCNESGWVFSD